MAFLGRLLFCGLCLALIAGAASFALLDTATPNAALHQTSVRSLSEAAKSVMLVLTDEGSYGTGFVVECKPDGKGLFDVRVLTAAHVAPESEESRMLTQDFLEFSVVSTHPTEDVMLLRFKSPVRLPVLDLGPMPSLGDRVTTLGMSGKSLWLKEGLISEGRCLTAPVSPGDSGGPVLDAQRRVVGVLHALEVRWMPWGTVEGIEHHCKYVPLHAFEEWLRVYVRGD